MYTILSSYLENGLQVVLHKIPGCKMIGSGVWVKQGSKHESAETSGYSHFIEHLMINKDNTEKNKYQENVNKVYKKGVSMNAGTTKEYTYYYITGLADTLQMSIETLASMLLPSADIAEGIFENEKQVVTQEAVSFYSSFNQIRERSSQALYGADGVGRTIVGSVENIREAKLDQLQEVIQASYNPDNAVLVVVGDIDYDLTLELVYKAFRSWKDQQTISGQTAITEEPGIYLNPNESAKSAAISFAFRSPSYVSTSRNAVRVMSNIIGDTSMQSRLMKTIRYDHGLAYTVGSFVNFYEQCGTFGMMLVCSPENAQRAAQLIANEIVDVRKNGFTDDEIAMAKRKLETSRRLELSDIATHLLFLGKNAVYGKFFSLEEELRSIHRIHKDDIHESFRSTCTEEGAGIAAIGNLDIDQVMEAFEIA